MAATVNNQFDLTDTVILITGGTGFLGEKFSRALTDAGATVVTGDVTDTADITLDVTSKDSVQTAVQQIITQHGHLDVVINNAAIDPKFDADADQNEKLFEDYPEKLLDKSLDVNLKGAVLVSQAAVKQFKAQGHGHIINISSMYGLVGPHQSMYPTGTQKPVDYSITKGGVNQLTQWLAATYGADNIRANTLTFGGVLKDHDKTFQKAYSAHTPLGRMVTPEEVTGPIVFLASQAASGMTGANLVVDGGWTAW